MLLRGRREGKARGELRRNQGLGQRLARFGHDHKRLRAMERDEAEEGEAQLQVVENIKTR